MDMRIIFSLTFSLFALFSVAFAPDPDTFLHH